MSSPLGFSDWYRATLGRRHVALQGVLWFLYGFIWIPLWYLSARNRVEPAAVAPGETSTSPRAPGAGSYLAWAAAGALLGWMAGEGQAKPFVAQMGAGFVMAFRVTGALFGATMLPFARLMCHRAGIEPRHFKRIGYWKVALVAAVGMGIGSLLGLILGLRLGAGFASMAPSMGLAFVGFLVPAMAWAKHESKKDSAPAG